MMYDYHQIINILLQKKSYKAVRKYKQILAHGNVNVSKF